MRRTAALAGLAAVPIVLPLMVSVIFLGIGGGAAPANAAGTTCTITTGTGGGQSGSPTGGVLTLSGAQTDNARTIIAAAKALHLPQQAAAIAVMTAKQESDLTDLANPTVPASLTLPHQGEGTNADSVGVFQQRPSMGWGSVAQLMDPGYAAATFLSHLAQVPGWQVMPAWQAAQAVQASADGTLYAQWQPLGGAIAAALWNGTTGALACSTATPGGPLPAPNSQAAAAALAYAQAQLGKPYIWGGTGPAGYDCSGLVQMAYATAGITLPRTSEQQWSAGPHIPADQLKPGDLVFFNPGEQIAGLPGHVGIYLGNGLMIHAPHTGDVIRVTPINDGDTYLGAIRPVPPASG